MKIVTSTKVALALLCIMSTLFAGTAFAQNAKMEKEFIFFVDGVNVQVPEIASGTVVNDPLNAESGNKVLKFGGGSWAENGLVWPTVDGGVDMTDFTAAEYGGSKTLYLKLLVDPANAANDLKLTFFDKGVVGPVAEADLRFRMNFSVPLWSRDGQWHELAIPLPPKSSAALDSAKAGKKVDGSDLGVEVDSLLQYWSYGGAWGSGAGVWGPDDANWKEFEWDAVEMVGFHFDWDGASGPVYVDNLYIGDETTDISIATAAPAEVGAVTIVNANQENTLNWPAGEGVAGYQVYYSDKPFTSVTDADVLNLGRVAGATTFKHSPLAPHPSVATGIESYYAVTSLSNFGTENQSIASSYKGVTGNVKSTPWIQEVDEETAFSILDNLDAGVVSNANFPDFIKPFIVTPNSKVTAGSASADEADLSAKVWIVYFEGIETGTYIIFYAEVTDEKRQFNLYDNGLGANGAWDYDSIELGFGGYQVESFLNGSSHEVAMRGAEPDYQFRMGKHSDGNNLEGFVYENFRFAAIAPDAQCLVDSLKDGSENVIGYKLIGALNINALQGGEEQDVLVDLPNDLDLKLYPFTFAVNDNDGAGRESQMNWSYKPNTTDGWWNAPDEQPSVAFAGKGIVVSNESENQSQLAASFELNQNYPNPFNPSTRIDFSLPSQSNVKLEVFNVLGQKVATLANEVMSSGKHSVNFDATSFASGMYLYKITAGSFVSSKKMMLIK